MKEKEKERFGTDSNKNVAADKEILLDFFVDFIYSVKRSRSAAETEGKIRLRVNQKSPEQEYNGHTTCLIHTYNLLGDDEG